MTPSSDLEEVQWIIQNADALDALREWPDESFQMCVTSPPYWGLRDYEVVGQIGLEKTPEEYVEKLVTVFRDVRRVLRDDGTLWLNLGDSYASHPGQRKSTDKAGEKQQTKRGSTACPSNAVDGLKAKDLIGIPWLVAFALRADGWYLRSDIIWHKPNPMPESVTDRPTKSHEYLFLLSKSERYFYDSNAIKEPATNRDPCNKPGDKYEKQYNEEASEQHRTKANLSAIGPRETRNRRDVWTVAAKPYRGAHFATFPPALITPCILAGCPLGGWVLDPFCGSGTTLRVARDLGRNSVGIELKEEYVGLAEARVGAETVVVKAKRSAASR